MLFNHQDADFRMDITNYRIWPNYSDLHSHSGYELYFLFSGSTNYIIEQDVYEIDEGDIVWITPQTLHITRPRDMERHKRMCFYIGKSLLEECLSSNPDMVEFFSKCHVFRPEENEKKYFRKLSNILLEEHLGEQPYSYLAMRGFLTGILVHMRRIYDKSQCTSPKTGVQNHNIPTEIKSLVVFINDNFRENITLESLAAQVNMSPVYISSLFKKHLGFNFREYLINLRIEKAKERLKSSGESIEDIAYRCGFNSSNHFCKTFKKLTGMPPKMFRSIENEK